MINYLFEKNIIIYIFAVLCGTGIILRLIMNVVYNGLMRETDNMSATKNKQLTFMKIKFESFYKLKIGVNNVDTFVDKNLIKHQFCGILLSTWDNMCGQVLFGILLLVPLSAVFGAVYQNSQAKILLTGAVGILASAILIIVDKSINLPIKKEVIKLNLLDYMDNYCRARMEKENYQPEILERLGREYRETVKMNKQISAAKEVVRSEPKNELDKRREVKRRREEEKKVQALKREEEQRKIEEARKEEERKLMEEKKRIAAKRREEEIKKIEEQKRILEAKRAAEAKKKEEEKLEKQEKHKDKWFEERDMLLGSAVEDVIMPDMENDKILVRSMEEIAAEKEDINPDNNGKTYPGKSRDKDITSQEEKVIEDILKEFFA
jgi:hypothetical protein